MPFKDILFIGLSQGCIYGLVAIGFVLIYKSTEMINFAQGELSILGAYLGIQWVDTFGSFWLSIPLMILLMFILGYLLDRLLIRPLLGHPPFSVIILTIALGLVMKAIIGVVWGYEPRGLATPYAGKSTLWGMTIDHNQLVLMATTICLCLGLWAFFKFSKWGLAMRAASQNQLAAFYVGIPVRRLYSISWALGAVVGAIGGLLLSTTTMVDPHSGLIGLKAFAAAVIGGLGSLWGAMAGGLIVGVSEQLAGAYLPPGSQSSMAYILMILVLVTRPHGLIQQVQLKKV